MADDAKVTTFADLKAALPDARVEAFRRQVVPRLLNSFAHPSHASAATFSEPHKPIRTKGRQARYRKDTVFAYRCLKEHKRYRFRVESTHLISFGLSLTRTYSLALTAFGEDAEDIATPLSPSERPRHNSFFDQNIAKADAGLREVLKAMQAPSERRLMPTLSEVDEPVDDTSSSDEDAPSDEATRRRAALAAAIDLVTAGAYFTKFNRGNAKTALKFVWMVHDSKRGYVLYWKSQHKHRKYIKLSGVRDLFLGRKTEPFQRKRKTQPPPEQRCFSIVVTTRGKATTLDLVADTGATRSRWVTALHLIVNHQKGVRVDGGTGTTSARSTPRASASKEG